ncbi:OmpA family protein [Flammeovirga sp. MY04]|uniref:OmpA family protein n=1 Tax=Flammeovirga sp. MY04 TaxID=1191459 RepID=UPI0008062472|nr:OmpA family protein [Flammeovirga sp. MY04]ANQ48002.1 OmpA family protein [Flammeovirga sp. MY04]
MNRIVSYCLYFTSFLLSILAPQIMYGQGDKSFEKVHFPNQTKELKVAIRNIEIGDNYKNVYHLYDSALIYYKKAEQLNSESAQLQFKIGQAFYLSDQLDSADVRLCNSLALDKNNLKTVFLAARVAHLEEKWDKAIELYEKYNSLHDGIVSPSKSEVDFLLSQTKFAKTLDNSSLTIKNLEELNSSSDDFQAHLHPQTNQLFFTSNRASQNSVTPKLDGLYYDNIYYFNSDSNQVKLIKDHIINPEGNSSVTGISKSGKTLIMYQGALQGVVSYSRFENINGENTPKGKTKLPKQINNYFFTQGSGTFTPDGKEFYFSGKRKKDMHSNIFISKRSGKKWTKPTPIFKGDSEHLNPYFSTNGDTLFFASNDMKSIGGYDIFYSVKKGNNWSEKVNLGLGINSPFDEISYSANEEGNIKYVASNRLGGLGNYDIYEISDGNNDKDELVLEKIITPHVNRIELTIVDAETKMPLRATQIQLYNLEENVLLRNQITDQNGHVILNDLPSEVDLGGNILKKGYEFYSRNFEIDRDTSNIIIELPPIQLNQKVTLENIFFDTNSSVIKDKSIPELRALLNFLLLNDKVNILIEGHTDNVGDKEYNQNLSNTRADAILRYLNQNGIPEYRLQAKGFGDTQPISENTNEEGRAKNRRTEFKVIKTQ